MSGQIISSIMPHPLSKNRITGPKIIPPPTPRRPANKPEKQPIKIRSEIPWIVNGIIFSLLFFLK